MRVGYDPENETEVVSLYLGEDENNHLVVNAFDLAGAMVQLEEGYVQDPFFSAMDAEGLGGVAGESDYSPDSDLTLESSSPTEASYLAAEVETLEPTGVMLLRRVNYEGDDTLEITGPDGAVYTFDYNQVVNYFRPILPR